MRISDWSSDVCSSDLQHAGVVRDFRRLDQVEALNLETLVLQRFLELRVRGLRRIADRTLAVAFEEHHPLLAAVGEPMQRGGDQDRKSVVSGKSVSVRVDPCVSRYL